MVGVPNALPGAFLSSAASGYEPSLKKNSNKADQVKEPCIR